MNRRDFVQSLAAAGATSSLSLGGLGDSRTKRQVIFVLGESVRADMLNCYRQTGLRTPNLDRLAADIIPTLMQFWGFEVPPTLEGESVLASFTDPDVPTRDAVFIEWGRFSVDHYGFAGYQPIRCVCDGCYKLSVNLMTGDELYDLESDPA